MSIFSSKVLKNKKIVFFAVFLFIILGLAVPHAAKADWNPVCWQWLWGAPTPGTFRADYCYFSGQNNDKVLGILGETGKAFLAAIVVGFCMILAGVFGALATLASGLLQITMTYASGVCYNCPQNAVVSIGWPLVRDLANMFIVLGFVVVGLATTLRIRDYEAKKILPLLIIVAVLVNFSLLMCGIFIDGSNIAMVSFLKGGGFLEKSAVSNVSNQISALWNNFDLNKLGDTIGSAVGIAVYDVVLFFVFILYIFLLLGRHVALCILTVLSPLGLVLYVFPVTQRFAKMWWKEFLGWCLVGIPAAFFLYISDKVAASILNNANNNGDMLGYLVPCLFLYVGYKITRQIAPMGADAAMGLASGTFGFALGAVTGGAGLAASATGLKGLAQRAGGAVKDKATSAGEKLGLVAKGTTASNKKSRLEESSKRLEKGFDDNPEGNAGLAKIATQRAFTAKQQQDKAAASALLAKRNAFGYIPESQREAAAAHAAAFGVAKETLTAKNPELITGVTDKMAQNKLMNDERVRLEGVYAGTSATPQQREQLIKKNLDRYRENMSGEAIQNAKREMIKAKGIERKSGAIPFTEEDAAKRAMADYKPSTADIAKTKTDLTSQRASRGLPAATDADAEEYLRRYYKPNATALSESREALARERAREKTFDFKYATRDDARKDLIDKEAKKLRDSGVRGSQLDSQIKKFGDGLTSKNIDGHVKVLTNERESKAIAKLTIPKLRELPDAQLDANLVQHSNYRTFSRAALEFTTEQKEKLKKIVPDLVDKKRLTVKPPPTYTGTTEEWKKLTSEQRANAYKLMTATQKTAHIASFSATEKAKIRDLNNKIKTIQNPNF